MLVTSIPEEEKKNRKFSMANVKTALMAGLTKRSDLQSFFGNENTKEWTDNCAFRGAFSNFLGLRQCGGMQMLTIKGAVNSKPEGSMDLIVAFFPGVYQGLDYANKTLDIRLQRIYEGGED